MEKKFIIGVDFGHGETSAFVIPLVNQLDFDEKGECLKINNSNNDDLKVVDSVIYWNPQSGQYQLNDGQGCLLYSYFKGRIAQGNDETNEHYETRINAFKEFIKLVVRRILENNQDLRVDRQNHDANFIFCIACPTRWTDEERKEYIDFFNKSLEEEGISVMFVMNESDAAFFSKREILVNRNNTLVIDYGSSTIDYTLMQNGRKVSKDEWSNPQLGAHNIESCLFGIYKATNDYQQTNAKVRDLLKQGGNEHLISNIDDRLIYVLRKNKEYAYTKNDDEISCSASMFKPAADLQLRKEQYVININSMSANIQEYIQSVKTDLETLRERIENNHLAVDNIILSGGASIMPWFQEIVKEVFENRQIIIDTHPSYVVAKGIALYAKAYLEAKQSLWQEIDNKSFREDYIAADKIACHEAVAMLIDSFADEINKEQSLTGIAIREHYCNFIQSLNINNNEYVTVFHESFDAIVSKTIREAIENAFKEAFNVEVNMDNINVKLNAGVCYFDDRFFQPNGEVYTGITDIIESVSTRWNFTWNVPRIDEEKTQLVYGTRDKLIPYIDDLEDRVTIRDIESIEMGIKEKVITLALEEFDNSQLFRTTFVD